MHPWALDYLIKPLRTLFYVLSIKSYSFLYHVCFKFFKGSNTLSFEYVRWSQCLKSITPALKLESMAVGKLKTICIFLHQFCYFLHEI